MVLIRTTTRTAATLLLVLVVVFPALAQFETRSTTSLGRFEPFAMTVGDFNRDGKPDLAVVTGGSVQVFLGKGDGTFRLPISYETGLSLVYSITSADLNGDGFLDLVATSAGTNSVEVFLGNGDGTFRAATDVQRKLRAILCDRGRFQ